MKILRSFTITLFFISGVMAQDKPFFSQSIDSWLIAGPVELSLPAFNDRPDLNNKAFEPKDLLDAVQIPSTIRIEAGELLFQKLDQEHHWHQQFADTATGVSLVNSQNNGYALYALATYLEVSRFSPLTIEIESAMPFVCYLNHIKSGNRETMAQQSNPEAVKIEAKLDPGKHLLLVKTLLIGDSINSANIKVKITGDEKYSDLTFTLSPVRSMSMKHVLEGERVNGVNISSDGKYILVSYSELLPPDGKQSNWYELRESQTKRVVYNFRHARISQVRFHPTKNLISYVASNKSDRKLILFDFNQGKEQVLMDQLEKFGSYYWSPDGKNIVFNISQKDEEPSRSTRKLEGMFDRWPHWRTRSQIFLLDVESRIQHPLTHGYISSSFMDFSPDGKKILIIQSEPDFSERLYVRQSLLEIDLKTNQYDTIINTTLSISARYSPDGKRLLVMGSPSLFGPLGVTTPADVLPNETDIQAYIFNLEDKTVKAFTRDFDPKILSADWSQHDKKVYLLTEDRSYQGIQVYDYTRNTFTELPTQTDMVLGFRIAGKAPALVYYGNSISAADKAMILNTRTLVQSIISDPEKEVFEDVRFGHTEEWNFTTQNGQQVHGHIYYPPDFDPEQKYPLIVNYYGGINPINRSFRGRYPKNYFASLGYVVYALTPSGSTGFGQEFAALHVNNWGITVADEIIESTRSFIASHSFINPEAVGCIGASYGGFMTQLLVTKTDLFRAAISHAGISSLASYWGEGYTGFLYSGIATANNFPWNNRDIYVEQSPLFHADKVNTPLLLLHGNKDTNVPPGESIQMYTALKLLGKTVEYVEVDGQDHLILDYKKRLEWQKTIMAWFDKWLKEQPEWWNDLYPERKL